MPKRALRGAITFALAAAGACAAPGVRAADVHTLAVSVTVLSKSACRFSATSSAIGLAIDPSSARAASAAASIVMRCTGSAPIATFALSTNNGLFGSSPASLRMRHATVTTEFLNYSLSYPASGSAPKGVNQTLTVTASVAPADFQDALPGTYSDTVRLSIVP